MQIQLVCECCIGSLVLGIINRLVFLLFAFLILETVCRAVILKFDTRECSILLLLHSMGSQVYSNESMQTFWNTSMNLVACVVCVCGLFVPFVLPANFAGQCFFSHAADGPKVISKSFEKIRCSFSKFDS